MEIVADRLTEMSSLLRPAVWPAGVLLVTTALALTACAGEAEDTSAPATPAATATTATPATPTPEGSATTEGTASPDDQSTPVSPTVAPDCPGVTRVTLTVPGSSGPRFAGYYAALHHGHYSATCLDVAIITAASAPEALATLSAGTADIAVSPLGEGLQARESGSPIVNVAQVFQRSGTIQVSFASAGIDSPSAFRGKRIGLGASGGWEVLAATAKAGLDPVADTSLTAGGGIDALLAGQVDAAAAEIYDGYQRLLGQPNPAGDGALTADDLTVIDSQAEAVGLLPDGLWVGADHVADGAEADAVQRFVTASLQGWIDCRDDAEACAALPDISPDGDTELGTRMMQAVNALVWPSPLGVGVMDPAARDRTVQVALVTKDLEGGRLITQAPDDGALMTTFATGADAQLSAEGRNVTG